MRLKPMSQRQQKRIHTLLQAYYREAERCEKAKAHVAACCMIGATLEACLLLMVDCCPDEAQTHAIRRKLDPDYLRWSLDDLIRVGVDAGWLPYAGADDPDKGEIGDWVLNSLKEIRNLVHPGRRVREYPGPIDERHCQSCFDIFHAALDHLLACLEGPVRPGVDEGDAYETS